MATDNHNNDDDLAGKEKNRSGVKYVDCVYLGQPYVGETCMHFAVANDDLPMVRFRSSTPPVA